MARPFNRLVEVVNESYGFVKQSNPDWLTRMRATNSLDRNVSQTLNPVAGGPGTFAQRYGAGGLIDQRQEMADLRRQLAAQEAGTGQRAQGLSPARQMEVDIRRQERLRQSMGIQDLRANPMSVRQEAMVNAQAAQAQARAAQAAPIPAAQVASAQTAQTAQAAQTASTPVQGAVGRVRGAPGWLRGRGRVIGTGALGLGALGAGAYAMGGPSHQPQQQPQQQPPQPQGFHPSIGYY